MSNRLAMLISGGGTTMREVIKACTSGEIPDMVPACVIASKPTAGGIEKAKALGVPERNIHVISPRMGPDAFAREMLAALELAKVDVVAQLGWLPRTPLAVIARYGGWIFNQHPGPLDPGYPDFGGPGMYGSRVHCARLRFAQECGDPEQMWTEAVAQRVHVNFDQGEVLCWERVPIEEGDTVASLQARVLAAEHRVQVRNLQEVARFLFARRAGRVLDVRLIDPRHYALLERCKEEAGRAYPHG